MRRRNFITRTMAAAAVLVFPIALSRPITSDARVNGITFLDRWILRQQDPETLAEWSCILNGWGWPKLLPDAEPPTYIPDGRRSQIMRWINNRIGGGAVLWKHNQSVMSREHFDDWRNMDQVQYKEKYPFRSRDFEIELQKRDAHKRAMYARHGAKHLKYVEAKC